MKLIKILAQILLILLVLIIIILLILHNKKTKNEEDNWPEGGDYVEYSEEIVPSLSEGRYYSVERCIEKFLTEINNLGNDEYKEQAKEKILNILDKEFISAENITTDNIEEKLSSQKTTTQYEIEEFYVLETETVDTYFVFGTPDEDDYIVKLDKMNNAYSILPISNIQEEMKDVRKYKNPQEIENVKYNNITSYSLSNEEVCRKYFVDYKKKLQKNINEAYALLNEEYSKSKFTNLKDFEEYIENIQAKNSVMENYDLKLYEDRKQIICQDQYGNYYVFDVYQAFKYTVRLDLYTIDVQETEEEYSEATQKKKVAMNIQKIITAINQKDYMYVYSKLSTEFREKNFPIKENLKEYIEKTFFEKNVVQFGKFSKTNDLYLYEIKIKDETTGNSINKTIIMKLKNGNDFVMSFNLE